MFASECKVSLKSKSFFCRTQKLGKQAQGFSENANNLLESAKFVCGMQRFCKRMQSL